MKTNTFKPVLAATLGLSFTLLGACSFRSNSANTSSVSAPGVCRGLDENRVNDMLRDASEDQNNADPDTLQDVPPEEDSTEMALTQSGSGWSDGSVTGGPAGNSSGNTAPSSSSQNREERDAAQQALNERYTDCANQHAAQNARNAIDPNRPIRTCSDLPGLVNCPDARRADFEMPMPILGETEQMTPAGVEELLVQYGFPTGSAETLRLALHKQHMDYVKTAPRAGCTHTPNTGGMVGESRFKIVQKPKECGTSAPPSDTSEPPPETDDSATDSSSPTAP